jgi:DNA (cytosine-5)-methyltransferase 1
MAARKKLTRGRRRPFRDKRVKVVDLYCGIGGLSHGLMLEGLDVVAGVDNDKTCKYGFEKNNGGKFIGKDISRFTARELRALFQGASVRVLVACAPCQPYSSLNRRKFRAKEKRRHWYPIYRFLTLVKRVRPEIVSMENVPDLSDVQKYPVFEDFVKTLKALKYKVFFKKVDASKYGVPQKRHRLVLLASRLGTISLIAETHADAARTVKQVIGKLPRLADGQMHPADPLHRSSKLSDMNKRRVIATPKDGGSATSWPSYLMPQCYRKRSGRSYMVTVYGRMRWNDPAPTMTTQFMTLGTGRFGHPTQNRAISLREAALFQSFPPHYEFAPGNKVTMKEAAKHIGNAVPVLLGRAIGKSIKNHVYQYVTNPSTDLLCNDARRRTSSTTGGNRREKRKSR